VQAETGITSKACSTASSLRKTASLERWSTAGFVLGPCSGLDCRVNTIDYGSKDGASIYRRTATLILCEAVREVDPEFNPVVGRPGEGISSPAAQWGHLALDRAPWSSGSKPHGQDRGAGPSRPGAPVRLRRLWAISAPPGLGQGQLLETTRGRDPVGLGGDFRDLIVGPLARAPGRSAVRPGAYHLGDGLRFSHPTPDAAHAQTEQASTTPI